MKLTRQQEEILINYGLNAMLKDCGIAAHTRRKVVTPRKSKRQWSEAQRVKFSKTMRKHWRKKKAGNNGQTV